MIYEYDVYASSVHKDRTENGQEIDTLSDRRLSWSIIRDILYERLFCFRRKDRPTRSPDEWVRFQK